MTREAVLGEAAARFDAGAFERRLADLVRIPSMSQDPARAPDLRRYLEEGMRPWLVAMGFAFEMHPNPAEGAGPILFAERIEGAGLPTVVMYGHGDTVLGMDADWTQGDGPWSLKRVGDRWYGRGAADNKGQHAINLFALEAVLAARGGRIGLNLKLVLEMAEETGSIGLRRFVEGNAERLRGDVFLGSDGPRVAPGTPTVAAGSRGNFRFDLVVDARRASVHSGHWGGLTTDPAVVLCSAVAAICDARGRLLVRDLLPNAGAGLRDDVRALLRDCPLDPGSDAARVEPDWGEPGLSAAERLYAWNAFVVLAMASGTPARPENAVAPSARATCQIRYVPSTDPATFVPTLRRHLDRVGFDHVRIENAGVTMAAGAVDPASPWVTFVAESLSHSVGKPAQVIPCTSGGMPSDVFREVLGLPLVWVPHGHNACRQHGPDEHILVAIAREGVIGMAGLLWDIGEGRHPR